MIDAKVLRQALDKFLKAPVVQAARMQVRTSARESHRIVIEVTPERAPMGKVIKDHGGILK